MHLLHLEILKKKKLPMKQVPETFMYYSMLVLFDLLSKADEVKNCISTALATPKCVASANTNVTKAGLAQLVDGCKKLGIYNYIL